MIFHFPEALSSATVSSLGWGPSLWSEGNLGHCHLARSNIATGFGGDWLFQTHSQLWHKVVITHTFSSP